jgi:serine/threonine protein kinase/Tol biopolymer transport system component
MNPGYSIAHYRITAKLGEGGMGEVWRATDTKLNRDVAIKILPEAFAQDPDRMVRFEREAQVLASLNHPNIAAIYGVEERALVMELVEGATLAERMAQGSIPPDETLPIVHGLIDALEYAHDRNVIHRDLKPANIKITREGKVKVLDFGLAKAVTPELAAGNPASSSTLTMRATMAGTIMGTAAYMSPEQARGHNVDRRADIWAFGVIIYEMLTGRTLFEAPTVSDTLAAVLTRDPDVHAVPPRFRRMLRLCLARDVRLRLSHISAARVLIEEEPAPATVPRRAWLPWTAVALLTCLSLALGAAWFFRSAQQTPVVKFSLPPPARGSFASDPPVLSPDGRGLLFTATVNGTKQLWVRALDEAEPRLLAGTDDASLPFWAPDSRFAGFFALGKLKKIDVAGGPPQTICEAGAPRGASWSRNNVILFTPNASAPLIRVPAAGGSPSPAADLDTKDGEVSHRQPWFLPDGRHYLFLIRNTDPEKTGVYVGDLESKQRHRVLSGLTNAIYVPPGFLLFVREGILMAQPFDAGRFQTTGDAVPVADRVEFDLYYSLGLFSASQTGMLAYFTGAAERQLTWLDRAGKPLGTVGQPGSTFTATISPDGGTIAYDRLDPKTGSYYIWLHDVAYTTDTRISSSGVYPIWSPDGSHILFTSGRFTTGLRSYQKPATVTGEEEPLLDTAVPMYVQDWSRDGRYMVFTAFDGKTGTDIWGLSVPAGSAAYSDPGRKPFPFLQTVFREESPRLSPDGRWLAYTSDQSNTMQIYVDSFPDKRGAVQMSTSGGTLPLWSRDGNELFYRAADGMWMGVDVKGGAKFEHGLPKPLFPVPDIMPRSPATRGASRFDISRDGKRFLIPQPMAQSENQRLTVVTNWLAGVKK